MELIMIYVIGYISKVKSLYKGFMERIFVEACNFILFLVIIVSDLFSPYVSLVYPFLSSLGQEYYDINSQKDYNLNP